MEIVKQRSGEFLDLRVSGRLDNHWSQPFDDAIEEMLREGAHHLRVDLTEVTYLSSAGIGVLMNAYRETKNLNGSFLITEASERVRTMLRLVDLESVLFALPAAESAAPASTGHREIQSDNALFESYTLGGAPSHCRLAGEPDTLSSAAYERATTVSANTASYALGVGALGHSFDECRNLFGEFIAASGSAAYMPTDGTTTPDYMTTTGELVPVVQALYAIEFSGSPSHLLRFETSTPGGGVPLSEVLRVCASVAGTSEFGVVMAAEVFGLVCAMLRRSPAHGDAARFEFPNVREWLSFTPEHEHARSSSLVVGIASSSPSATLRPFVRPVSDEFVGHFHAAVIAFRSLPRGKVQIREVLAQAFQPRSVTAVVHLLRDDRPIEGAGESEFQRGACWVFPLASIERGDPS